MMPNKVIRVRTIAELRIAVARMDPQVVIQTENPPFKSGVELHLDGLILTIKAPKGSAGDEE